MSNKAEVWQKILAESADKIGRNVRIMEVCGSHTVAIARSGLRRLLPNSVKLISGPGCPVCVSTSTFIEQARTLAKQGIKVCCFGDLLHIPGVTGRLSDTPNILVIYSPEEALEYAVKNPQEEVVFAAVGFEPTLSATSALISEVVELGIKKFSLLSDFKNLYPVLGQLMDTTMLDGFILPGHVASVVGEVGLQKLGISGVITGFDPERILHAIWRLLEAINCGECATYNEYPEAVRYEGSIVAKRLISEYFEVKDASWRGIGMVKNGGWYLQERWSSFDAVKRYNLSMEIAQEPAGCSCGQVLSGKIEPAMCPLFGKRCTPENPVGPCMVSAEGACQAQYQYREVK